MSARPASAAISRDIHAIEADIETLRGMLARTDGRRLIVMGPGSHGCDALDAHGGPYALQAAIEAYDCARRHLVDQHSRAEITETLAQVRALHGRDRAQARRYLLDLIEGYRDEPAPVQRRAA
ncbi:MAG: hypothetical protein WDN25_13195 [Acetobacteraceae bacterium]